MPGRARIHPRTCREHPGQHFKPLINYGSSPQARGTLRARARRRWKQRFIPAGAGNTSYSTGTSFANAVHPRRRGEHAGPPHNQERANGSSPQARGTRGQAYNTEAARRFIPAGAGNTARCQAHCGPRPVHPRRRGEHLATTSVSSDVTGSSPQARGTRPITSYRPCFQRFIPAGAGNTRPVLCAHDVRPVHPRRRGEHTSYEGESFPRSGSSPQARGTRRCRRPRRHGRRFIPAGAGNTLRGYCVFQSRSVHPRRRGEHGFYFGLAVRSPGSSPQARGTPSPMPPPVPLPRFIPAGAGNTTSVPRTCLTSPVHPRRRGEHLSVVKAVTVAAGSSPQARGTRRLLGWQPLATRFIPAGAGNTAFVSRHERERPVHPRRRGEHTASEDFPICADGSSPQARGTRARPSHNSLISWFIPAGAGNTSRVVVVVVMVHPRRRGEHAEIVVADFAEIGSSPQARGTPK